LVRTFNRSGDLPLGQLPIRADEVAGIAVGDAFQIILMFQLGLPEEEPAGAISVTSGTMSSTTRFCTSLR